jgi:hypothetical protein
MKKLYTGMLGMMLLAATAYPNEAKAQGGVIDVLGGGISDANKLMNAYLGPMGESFAIGLGQNWFNTANPLKLGRFNLQFGASLVMIPESKQTFDAAGLNLQNLIPTSNEAPTLFGKGAGPDYILRVEDPNNPGQYLNVDTLAGLTRGLGLAMMAAPFAQLNLGLIKGTEIGVRYLPSLDLGSLSGGSVGGSISLWGVGVKHDIKQWIPVVKKLPFSMSGYFNYTRLSFNMDVSMAGPESNTYAAYTGPGDVVGFDYANGTAGDYSSQAILLNSTSMGFGLIVSKKLPVITPYLSLGFQNATFSLKTAGDYAILSGMAVNSDPLAPEPGAFREQYSVFTDPINISPDAISAFRYGVGLRAKLLIFGLHAEYFGVGEFSGVNVGLSLGF